MTAMRGAFVATLLAFSAARGHGATIVLSPIADATIFQNNVDNGSGGGNGLYAGTNSAGSPRRALIAFDVAGSLPPGSVVQSVELTAVLGQISGGGTPPPLVTVGIYRASAPWGNGSTQQRTPPDDVISGMGQGAAAVAGDVTWSSRFYSTTAPTLWSSPGGDFGASASASVSIGTTLGVRYSWPSTAAAVADVQSWLDAPTSNFGWLLKVVDESSPITLRGFYSSNVNTSKLRPELQITFQPPQPGDFNGDGSVNGDDLTLWRNQFGTIGALSADADLDHDVDGTDFLTWQRHSALSLTAVPEPIAWVLLVTGTVVRRRPIKSLARRSPRARLN